ncbi:chemotaxis protein CheX [Salipaludibacillus neizhouensis]|uniref:Chemotaxis protein CheX n=1 Tax=Salipaludibacillus neizhouensis TaxID=885475 RepID=A0A3A9JZJ1_9BACI|nr:chemotaxis protein CheX [Salipaludibacillus neizhouensis]RKL65599.1 chemotaxis protein CheX [Salipaludibacillus neizhouensis]
MNAKHINAVCKATKTMMNNHFGVEISHRSPQVVKEFLASNEVSAVLGVHGELNGQIICSFDAETAKKIVGSMMGGMAIETLDDMGWSAIQEFGNWVAGATATELSAENIIVDVTPPVVNDGRSNFRSTKRFITIPMDSIMGKIEVHISLSENSD